MLRFLRTPSILRLSNIPVGKDPGTLGTMAESSASGPSRPKILEQLVEAGKAAFDPSITEGTAKEAGLKRYDDLVQR